MLMALLQIQIILALDTWRLTGDGKGVSYSFTRILISRAVSTNFRANDVEKGILQLAPF